MAEDEAAVVLEDEAEDEAVARTVDSGPVTAGADRGPTDRDANVVVRSDMRWRNVKHRRIFHAITATSQGTCAWCVRS